MSPKSNITPTGPCYQFPSTRIIAHRTVEANKLYEKSPKAVVDRQTDWLAHETTKNLSVSELRDPSKVEAYCRRRLVCPTSAEYRRLVSQQAISRLSEIDHALSRAQVSQVITDVTDDVCADVLIEITRKPHGEYRQIRNPRQYFWQVAVNLIRKSINSALCDSPRSLDDEIECSDPRARQTHAEVQPRLIDIDPDGFAHLLPRVRRNLSDTDRELFDLLIEIQQRNSAEIARETHLSMGQIAQLTGKMDARRVSAVITRCNDRVSLVVADHYGITRDHARRRINELADEVVEILLPRRRR